MTLVAVSLVVCSAGVLGCAALLAAILRAAARPYPDEGGR